MYDSALTLRAARDEYFARSGFAAGGNYDDKLVWVKLGRWRVPVLPNSRARVRAVRLHDLHHVLAEYDTSWTGESEIGAWELASGCRSFVVAWLLNIGAMAIGLVIAPRRVARAFARGRQSDNLYRGEYDEAMLERTVGDMRAELGL